MIFLLAFQTLLFFPTEVFAYPNNDTEFKEYVETVLGKPFRLSDGKEANWYTYQMYNQVVWGLRHGTLKNSSLCGNAQEPQYLGYNDNGVQVTNSCYPNSPASSGHPKHFNFINVDEAIDTWQGINANVTNHIQNSGWTGNGATEGDPLLYSHIGSRSKVELLTLPTWRSEGSVYTENRKSNGLTYYATFVVPGMARSATTSGRITTDKETYTITATSSSVTALVKAQAEAILSGYMDYNQVENLSVTFKGAKATTTGQQYATLFDQPVKFSRDKYSPGTHEISLFAGVEVNSIFGDTAKRVVEKKITLVVEAPSTPIMTTTGTASPSTTTFNTGDTLNDVDVNVTVNGKITGFTDVSRIEKFELIAREDSGSYVLRSAVYTGAEAQTLSKSSTFSFVIPKSKFSTDAFIQPYVVRARATLDDGTVITSTATTSSEVYPPGIEPVVEEPEIPNIPPVAMLYADPDYYWVETFTFQDHSYDVDNEIVGTDFRVDGAPSGFTYSSSRVTSPKLVTGSLTVTDEAGDSSSTTRSVTILPTIPIADMDITGTLKENRKIIIDATPSDYFSPVHVAPIDYSKTQWTIRPITPGINPAGIKIRLSSDFSKRELLVREAGEYEVSITVTNTYNETSEVTTKTFVVEEDVPPTAKFTIDKKIAIRDGTTRKATFRLTDQSTSFDNDLIKKRVWYVRYDSNNDGFINTQDGPRQIISDGNETIVTYSSDKVGNYQFSLEVIEDFGQPTLPEFILAEHYLKDSSDPLNADGDVAVYMQDTNFNVPETDKIVEIDNAPPIIDFGATRHNKVDIVLNFGGLDTATQKHLTGAASGGGSYDHYSYDIDATEKNTLTSFAGTLEASLKQKGIDCTVTVDNSYYTLADSDGTCIRNIPVYGWRDYGSYSYSSYSGTSPYSGSWEVTSSSSTPIQGVVWCYWVSPTGIEYSHAPPCTSSANAQYGTIGYTYTASLRKWYSDMRWVVVSYTSKGCNSSEQVDTTDFSQAFSNQTYRADANNYYIRFDKRAWTWRNNTTKWNAVTSKAKNSTVNTWNRSVPENRLNAEQLTLQGSGKGKYEPYDAKYLRRNIRDIENYFINQYMVQENGESLTIVLGDRVDYTTSYTDFEQDPELRREWKFTHDHTTVNGRVIDNQTVRIPQSGLWLNGPVAMTQPGTYTVQLRAMDDPIHWGDDRFFNYRKWSDQEVQREYNIHVHRRPIADFCFTIDVADNYRLNLNPGLSYDPDHQFNRADKGIVETTWVSYTVDNVEYAGAPPTNLTVGKNYDVTLQVKDIDGAYATVTKRISTEGLNIKPVAIFDLPDVVDVNQTLEFVDRSYDPNGDALTNYQITVRKQGESTILKTLTTWPTSFAAMSLPVGKYVIGLTVEDVPKVTPILRSDLYEKNVEVLKNNRPISVFSLSPSPLEVDKLATYTDSSSDPDGHSLSNYSWRVELLDLSGSYPVQTWQVGYPPIDFTLFAGVGTYRITQTVFDDPPYPLTSLSGTSTSITLNVIQGKKKPYAEFIWSPEFPIAGQTIVLDPSPSYDVDGTVGSWQWRITSPTGAVTNSTLKQPSITNAVEGNYQVRLHVVDNDGLRSQVEAVHHINVKPKPPNVPPAAQFIWDPNKPMLGDQLDFNPDGSYDIDGTITAWSWRFVSKEGIVTTSALKYPSMQARSEWYDVTLRVTDNAGATHSITKKVIVDITGIEALVTHTPDWQNKWVKEGYDKDINIFRAGEIFVIELKTKPAHRVWGSVNFGGKVGLVNIPYDLFQMVSYDNTNMEMLWRAELGREDFVTIKDGEYMFTFHSIHPQISPSKTATTNYFIEIEGNIYGDFHQSY